MFANSVFCRPGLIAWPIRHVSDEHNRNIPERDLKPFNNARRYRDHGICSACQHPLHPEAEPLQPLRKASRTRRSSPVFVRIINQGCAADPCNDEADWQGVEVIGVYHARSNLIARPEHPKSTLGVFDKLHQGCLRPAAGPKWNSDDPESKDGFLKR
jgi:hypothetical protein